jgi:Family of unknown function (DUF5683)
MMKFLFQIVLVLLMLIPVCTLAQKKDTVIVKDSSGAIISNHPIKTDSSIKNNKKDSAILHRHTPKGATIRSAIIPGWGQIYNNKWWKLPLVYAAVGIPIGFYVDNKKFYNETNYAIAVVANGTTDPDSLNKVDPKLRPLVDAKDEQALLNTRNEVRKNMDYSILFTLFFWGLQVVDATVDAHLRYFDISPELSFKIKPAYFPDSRAVGISMAFNLHKKSPRLASSGGGGVSSFKIPF